jgi:hypothetical protein
MGARTHIYGCDRFKAQLPELCALLHSKVFPDCPFSDDLSDSLSRSSSPAIDNEVTTSKAPQKRAKSSSRASAHNQSLFPRPSTTGTMTTSFPRSRSRSLSVSLAQDVDTRSVGVGIIPKKRALNREVSMSRVFKEKPARKDSEGKEEVARTKVKAPTPSNSKDDAGLGVTLVVATPVKPQRRANLQTLGPLGSLRLSRSPTPGIIVDVVEEDDWSLPSSPDVLLLGTRSGASEGHDRPVFGHADRVLATDTPVKKSRGVD